jgi:hypothetical protein
VGVISGRIPDKVKPAGEFMKQVLARVMEDPEAALLLLQELWPEMVGTELARFTRPLRWDGRNLVVAVPGEVWVHHLCELEHLFVDRVNGYWHRPLVETIRFEIGLLS